jgi:hypothetical protein
MGERGIGEALEGSGRSLTEVQCPHLPGAIK